MKCPHCRTEIPGNAGFRVPRGQTLQAQPVCGNCSATDSSTTIVDLRLCQPLTATQTPAAVVPTVWRPIDTRPVSPPKHSPILRQYWLPSSPGSDIERNAV